MTVLVCDGNMWYKIKEKSVEFVWTELLTTKLPIIFYLLVDVLLHPIYCSKFQRKHCVSVSGFEYMSCVSVSSLNKRVRDYFFKYKTLRFK